ncbi:hypothetical protein ROG8370_02775 [Roseovarius gaetbuli]|uniref:Uncharacterized protein n=1 Tax=Roseovarius gaetbuli TaxID=1356575 RepID=A0A1X6ZUP6_9RHOB|nr:hypothetical protein ROG8370_02775 [Roseovarius gaetbuli]
MMMSWMVALVSDTGMHLAEATGFVSKRPASLL